MSPDPLGNMELLSEKLAKQLAPAAAQALFQGEGRASIRFARKQVTVLHALPAALAGIVWALFVTGTTLSVPALTGAIMSMGVATANSILVVSFCRERLAWPAERLNPPPLLDGSDLIAHGLAPGPQFALLLEQIRDAQLNGEIHSQAEALALADRLR